MNPYFVFALFGQRAPAFAAAELVGCFHAARFELEVHAVADRVREPRDQMRNFRDQLRPRRSVLLMAVK